MHESFKIETILLNSLYLSKGNLFKLSLFLQKSSIFTIVFIFYL